MAKLAQFKDLTGTVNGTNVDFYVPSGFLPVEPDSERLFVRGIPRVKAWDDGWDVIDYPTGHIRLKEAPLLGDAPPALLFLQDLGDVTTGEVTPISGFVKKAAEITGGVGTRGAPGRLVRENPVEAQIRRPKARGRATIQRKLVGKVCCCE